jgi:N-carbamoyl-L-amino-acid hydrolase
MAASAPFLGWLDELAAIGGDPEHGWCRFAWTEEDRKARDWFAAVAGSLELEVEQDGNGNLWAWWGGPGPGAIVTGSHLDTVAGGGAYDGALGIVSGFAAIHDLKARRGDGEPPHPIVVTAFADEEGGRFNLPCFGSRLLTGALTPAAVLGRTDVKGNSVSDVLTRFGLDPMQLGDDLDRLARVRAVVELHVEQGRGLVDLGAPIGVATGIWPHGRWRLELTGRSDHAGTTRLVDRRDPVVAAAEVVLAVRDLAAQLDMVATVGRLVVSPNTPNAIAAGTELMIDARAPTDHVLDGFLARLGEVVDKAAGEHGVEVESHVDSRTIGVTFDEGLNVRIEHVLTRAGIATVRLPTAAGHDAGILAAHVPTAMLFVRNPVGSSHTPSETATVDDCLVGVDALAAVLEDLAWR